MRFLLVLVFLTSSSGFAQFQNNNWRFGYNGGLNFDSVGNVTASSGETFTQEGSCSISDRNTGALLFYTDGITAYNANNEVMLNGTGLLGGTAELTSSTSAAAIVRAPGSETLYYIFTLDEQSSSNGLRYSIVDMTLDGGLGGIQAGSKNVALYSTTSEKLQIVPNASLNGYWIITHDNQEALVTFALTASGVSTTPVISNITSPQFNGAGHFKVNRTFDRLAMGSLFDSNISLYDFDNATGVFSNPVSWSYNFGTTLQYGVEFSPNGQVLYVSNLEKIVQYDISSNDPVTIENSGFEVFIGNFQTGNPATMQIAINNKIYVNNGGSIGVINCPNFLGAACNWQANAVPGASFGGYGLHIWSYDIEAASVNPTYTLEATDNCAETNIDFSLNIPFEVDEVNVQWGDGNSDSFTSSFFSYTYLEEGSYDIDVEVIRGCDIFQFDTTFVVQECSIDIPDFIVNGDLCDILAPVTVQVPVTSTFDQVVVNFGEGGSAEDEFTYSTPTNSIFSSYTYSEPGVYEICVNYLINGLLDTVICQNVEIALCCEFEILVENLCTEAPILLSVVGTNEINAISWEIITASGEVIALDGLQVEANLPLEGNYLINALVNGVCGDTLLTRTITVANCERIFCDPFIPNVFTPNGDGTNEFFAPVFSCGEIDYELRIFNRWGEKIYDSANTNRGWNGGGNGYFVPDGVYIYEVEYQRSAVNRKVVSGLVTVLR